MQQHTCCIIFCNKIYVSEKHLQLTVMSMADFFCKKGQIYIDWTTFESSILLCSWVLILLSRKHLSLEILMFNDVNLVVEGKMVTCQILFIFHESKRTEHVCSGFVFSFVPFYFFSKRGMTPASASSWCTQPFLLKKINRFWNVHSIN